MAESEENLAEQANQAKRRRVQLSCAPCRSSKVRCDRLTPCTHCRNASIECWYYERPEVTKAAKIERLEAELAHVRARLDAFPMVPYVASPATANFKTSPETVQDEHRFNASRGHAGEDFGYLSGYCIRQYCRVDAVTTGAISENDALAWFAAFFAGCDRFVPVFDAKDTYESVRTRSNVLFDIIVIYGARGKENPTAASGYQTYQSLYGIVRQHTSDLVLRLSDAENKDFSIEDIQASLIIASYTEGGSIICDIAIRAAIRFGLPARLECLLNSITERSQSLVQDFATAFKPARTWCYTAVLDSIRSLDGGRLTSMTLHSPRSIKTLLNHPERTTQDVRLFAQVELNALRSSSYTSLVDAAKGSGAEDAVRDVIRSNKLDLDVWLAEWRHIIANEITVGSEHDILGLNFHVQHAWAILALHLRALTALGIENIALMTEIQRRIAYDAKTAAEQHLQLILTRLPDTSNTSGTLASRRPYIDNFPYAMEFVWAKNAFCVLIALRLGILLADPVDEMRAKLSEANDFLRELDRLGVGMNISYSRILSKTVQKCEKAIQATLEHQSLADSANSSDSDFESFVPRQFVFEWDFPGLHLCYIPLDWRDLFQDTDTAT